MCLSSRDGISHEIIPGFPWGAPENNSRSPAAFLRSREFAQVPRDRILIYFGQEPIKFATGNVILHLPIPLIILPLMKAPRQFLPFLQCEKGDSFFDLVKRHTVKLLALVEISKELEHEEHEAYPLSLRLRFNALSGRHVRKTRKNAAAAPFVD